MLVFLFYNTIIIVIVNKKIFQFSNKYIKNDVIMIMDITKKNAFNFQINKKKLLL